MGSRRFARLGTAIPGLEIRVVDPATGNVLQDREVGELEIRGTSVTTGYYKRPDANAELFRDGWLRTGDLAYLIEGELVVCGRIKDVIIVGGRNVFPEDVERAVGQVDGVRAGNVIAFGIAGRQGKEGLIVVAETKAADDEAETTRRSVAERIRETIGIPAKEVVLVSEMEAGWYRYVSEWRLHTDGTIKPRFGFSAELARKLASPFPGEVFMALELVPGALAGRAGSVRYPAAFGIA